MPTGHSRSVVFVCRSVSLISTFVFRFLSQLSLPCSYYFVSIISIRVLLLMYIFPVFSQITLTIFIFQNENKVMTNAMHVNHIVNVKSPTSERCFSGLRNLLAFAHNLIVQSCFSSDNSAFYYPDLLFDHASVN